MKGLLKSQASSTNLTNCHRVPSSASRGGSQLSVETAYYTAQCTKEQREQMKLILELHRTGSARCKYTDKGKVGNHMGLSI